MIMSEICYVYILKTARGTHYTGITKDLLRRMQEHADGQSKSTRHGRPLELVWVDFRLNRTLARELEVMIKARGAEQFLKTYGKTPNVV